MINLFPKVQIPYYIPSPSYTHTSSGVRTLHLLCHALNEAGEKAYLVPTIAYAPGNYTTHPHLNTPVISKEVEYINFYGDSGIDPIFVYPDIVDGNPFAAKRVVRMYLGKIGEYNHLLTLPEVTDQIWGALPSIADNVLRVPVSDPNIFYDNSGERFGACYYSHKFDKISGNRLSLPDAAAAPLQGTLEQVADILRRSTVCYLYEMSSIITEAALCGCPVVLMRSSSFDSIDPESMMGSVRWNDGEVVKECDNYLPEYQKFIDDFPAQLENFINKTHAL